MTFVFAMSFRRLWLLQLLILFHRMMLIFSNNNSATELNLPPAELTSLEDLYTATNGENWHWKQGKGSIWNFTGNPNPCTSNWQGVVCCGNVSLGDSVAHVTELQLSQYNLVGSIPTSLVNLTMLEKLVFYGNALTGTIPSQLASLGNLIELSLYSNTLTGTISPAVGNMHQLQIFFVSSNTLSGQLPSSFGGLYNVLGLDLGNNSFTGPIPSTVGNMSKLEQMDGFLNAFTGTIPTSLANLSRLNELFLYLNKLTGSIPLEFGELRELAVFATESNDLTGSIPDTFSELHLLALMDIGQNRLTGTIPSGFSSLINMVVVDFDSNLLSGTLPSFLGTWSNLLVLDLDDNLFTGTIPSSIGDLAQLAVLDLVSNCLTGKIPATLANLENLLYLTLFRNSLEGTLDGVLNSTTQKNLFQVDLYDNQLSGSIPTELFRLPALSIVSLASNCFTGTLPADVCNIPHLKFLVLDGLHTSSSCRSRIWALSDSYVVYNGFYGTIPPCIFALPQLQILHLSGNGFSGKLPENILLNDNLDELLLSHNSLSGTIPSVFQTQRWNKIDLSYNRLGGILSSEFGLGIAGNGTVYVQNNRLSGEVPSYLVHLQDVSALGSNIFSCKTDKSDLPQHDSSFSNYQCGSDAFNDPWYAFLIAGVIVMMVMTSLVWWPELCSLLRRLRSCWDKYRAPKQSLPSCSQQVYTMVEILCQVSVFSTIIILIVLVPWYATASHYWSTYTHSYAWVVSAAFISGLTPGVTELFLFITILSAVIAICALVLDNTEKHGLSFLSQAIYSTDSELTSAGTSTSAKMYVAVVVVNLIVVIGANIGFVSVALTQSSAILTLSQILLSVFKFLWNAIYVRALVNISTSPQSGRVVVSTEFFAVQTAIGITNNIIVPCLVVAVLSPSCFYSVFNTPQSVESSYYLNNCNTYSGGTICFEIDDKVVYQPPFVYDYQCSSFFVTYYAPTFVYLAITAALVAPIVHMLTLYAISVNTTTDSLSHRFLNAILPVMLRSTSTLESLPPSVVMFDSNHWLSVQVIYLGILLTFGMVFPPLAATMCFTMLSVAWQMKLSVGRLISNAREMGEEQFQQIYKKLEEDCRGAASLEKLRIGMLLLIGSAFCFYALFVFDTVGDAEGFGGAYWVLIVMPLMTVCLIVVVHAHKYVLISAKRREGEGSESGSSESLEMQAFPGLPDSADPAVSKQTTHIAGRSSINRNKDVWKNDRQLGVHEINSIKNSLHE